MPAEGAQVISFVTQIWGAQGITVVQVLVAGPTRRPVQTFVPVALTVSVMEPQKPAGIVFVACQGAEPLMPKSPMTMVWSSEASLGVPLSSTTLTPVSGTLPQLVTIP